jgi:small-conductance mechanosensitive channel
MTPDGWDEDDGRLRRELRFGNFSVLPWSYVDTLVLYPELWNHYAATVLKSRLPHERVRCDRAKRKRGTSHMDFVSLVIHGVSALLANQELVGTRLLVMLMMLTAILTAVIGVVAGVRLFTDLGIPGWATSTVGLVAILVGQALIAAFLLMFSTMMQRNQLGFLPVRDYAYFAGPESVLHPHD